MKKCIALLLCLILALGSAVSFAESAEKTTIGTISINGAFTLKCALPEGYRIQPLKVNQDQVVAIVTAEDPMKPMMQLSVAFDELYAEVDRMNDLTDEQLEVLERTFTDVDPTIEITYGDTGWGTRVMMVRQSGENQLNYVDFLSVYKGYFVEFVLLPSKNAEDKTLTDEQIRMCVDFLTELDFIPVGETETVTEGTDSEVIDTETEDAASEPN